MKSFTWKDIKIISFIISIITLFSLSICILNKKIKPVVTQYSQNKCEEIANLIINNSVLEIIGKINQPFIIVNKDTEGKITDFSYNSVLLNKIVYETSNLINKNIKSIQEGKLESLNIVNEIIDYKIKNNAMYYQIPLFIGSSNPLFSSLGPKIPIKFQLMGNAKADLLSNINDYGINNVIVELLLKVTVKLKVLLPFNRSNNIIETKINIASLAIQGEIPDYIRGITN